MIIIEELYLYVINIASSESVKHTVYNRSEYTHVASL